MEAYNQSRAAIADYRNGAAEVSGDQRKRRESLVRKLEQYSEKAKNRDRARTVEVDIRKKREIVV